MRARHRSLGFTLIEVLVALSIVAIALMAGMQATNALTNTAARQSDLLLAHLCAENELTRIRLLTNSPHKLRELRARGIDVQEMESLVAASNVHNERYIRTKRDRAGHIIPGDS